MMEVIRSSANKTYKLIKSLSAKKARSEHGCFLVEGIKSVTEAISAGTPLRMIAVSKSARERCGTLIRTAQENGAAVYVFDDRLFHALCDTKTPEGVLCAAEIPQGREIASKDGLYLYCDCVSDPGNAGTLIRCADAVGAAGAAFSAGCVDIYSPKVVRATMGSLFHLPVYDGVDIGFLIQMKQRGYRLLAGALTDTAADYRTVSYPDKTVIIIGNEANGVSDEVLALCDSAVIIPITGRAESLNASVAGALLLYEWRRNHT